MMIVGILCITDDDIPTVLRYKPYHRHKPPFPSTVFTRVYPPPSFSTTAYESEDKEELLERSEDGWMFGASVSDTDTRRAGAQATQGAAGALGGAEAGTCVLDSIAKAERKRREAGEVGE
ncbi:hypothetical protein L202_06685 [Cryptococcus amylolentus CBS 6039]|uniref:Uncharacterized protein n=1 Tax=Cryptococcus amylolentus CBS 6039 TaxID=1295533 RepID=A0A1E3HGT1_9TREE|nr:hypothetical protein L202_06685 [Cryptococcus amylolentus CBS 6039]ODN75558.1 hypothetical protein L202_06685 [Cryptococcus amylolentus CBS 6039]